MSDKKKPTEFSDHFSSYMQQRLKGHQLPPDDACWNEIEERLQNGRKRIFWKKGMYIAAAVLAILLLVSIPWMKQEVPEPKDKIVQTEAIPKTVIPDIREEASEPVLIAEVIKTPGTAPIQPVPERIIVKAEETKEVEETVAEEVIEEESKETEPAVDELKKIPFHPHKYPDELPPVKRKKGSKWSISGSLGTGSNGSFLNAGSVDQPQNDYSNIGGGHIPVPPELSTGIKQPEDFDEISYNIPLSFGVTARKALSESVAIETGIVYTYLSTRLGNYNSSGLEGKLGLHYLGIPVNLIVKLWDNQPWNIYVSGGVMGEKGLRSIYTQREHFSGQIRTNTIKTSISGTQWSLNGALGVSYRIYKDWSIYAEPRVSYYFDTDQPISIRTEKTVHFGIAAGLRYEF